MLGSPTAAQQRFHEWCRERGCMLTGGPASIHHIKGSRFKLKHCDKPGEWLVLPICYYWHQDLENKAAIHSNRKAFEQTHSTTEKELWLELMEEYKREHGEYPMHPVEYEIIKVRA